MNSLSCWPDLCNTDPLGVVHPLLQHPQPLVRINQGFQNNWNDRVGLLDPSPSGTIQSPLTHCPSSLGIRKDHTPHQHLQEGLPLEARTGPVVFSGNSEASGRREAVLICASGFVGPTYPQILVPTCSSRPRANLGASGIGSVETQSLASSSTGPWEESWALESRDGEARVVDPLISTSLKLPKRKTLFTVQVPDIRNPFHPFKAELANGGPEHIISLPPDSLSRASACMMGDEEESFSLGIDKFCNTKRKLWTLGSGVIALLAFIVSIVAGSVHKINEGNVGVYFKYGALMDHYSLPGIHLKAPFVTDVKEVSVRPHTDTLPDFTTVTRDGIQNTFFEVQVISDVNMDQIVGLVRRFGMDYKQALVFDRIKEELRIFCANHTVDEVYNEKFLAIVAVVKAKTETSIKRLGQNGIKLLNLVIPKPDIPPDIAINYKMVKVQWTEQLVAVQQQKTEQIKKETESLKAVADANRQKAVLQIEIQKQVIMKEGEKDVSLLDNEIVRAREESNADVETYKKHKDAEGNAALYTKEYVQLEMAKSLSNNTKYFFSGEQSVLGALLKSVLGDEN